MFEDEEALIRSEGIELEEGCFPYKYFDNYIVICNPDIQSHEELVEHLNELKAKVDSHTYEVVILHGAVVKLMRDYHYDFITAMIRDKEFCDWVTELNREFEEHHQEVEDITKYHFD
jgi:hypothetical protein